MKTITIAALLVALSAPALAQQKAEDHSAHHPAAAASAADMTEGEIRKVDKDAKKLTIKHGEIKNLDMPPMTMVFQVKDASVLDTLKAGDKVQAVIVRCKFPTRRDDGSYVRFDSNACVLVDKDGNPKGTTKNRPVRSAHTNVSMRTTHHTNELPKRRPSKAHA